ncbi:endolytic transglycosylase MltG [Nitrospirillum sp. BR 11163]|uniref:endolytic transglycosylase MltG n=1 Tax=Nitrospirillum sp. BR 11163 TaxID=3104323 RepID=UPI002AFF2DA2|nr:endolytic transglycosylase MltG [Nitrospirillum sp. BR 11163]MEA1675218.1 endolytic transglycosylase MltG [Nitrospirillum sp. BR 11163]
MTDKVPVPGPKSRLASSLGRRLLQAAALVVLVSAALAWVGYHRYVDPGPLTQDRVVVVSSRGGLQTMGQTLAEAGVVRGDIDFVAAVRVSSVLGVGSQVPKPGEYAFPAHVSLKDVVALLRSGKTVVHRLTIPEGLTSAQIVALIEAEPALSGTITEKPAEGSLLPETYFFGLNYGRAQMVERMRAAMRKAVDEIWEARAPGVALKSPEEMVTMASLVEKETGVPAERPHIAAVFYNRLKLGMRLQSDPTVIYILTNGAGPLGRTLTHADLAVESPYNTYVVAGLPPGPIANPGREALRAVANPLASADLYFVADGSGGHAFATSLAEHNRNVDKWRDLREKAQR